MGSKKKPTTTTDITQNQQSQTQSQAQSQVSGQSGQTGSFANTNTYDWSPERSSKDIDALRTAAQGDANPATDYAFGAQLSDIDKTFGNVTGAYGSPELDAQRKLSAKGSARQAYGSQKREDEAERYGKLAQLAQLTAPQREMTGQSGTQQSNAWMNQFMNSMGTQTGTTSGTQKGTEIQDKGSQGFWGSLIGSFI